MALGKQDVRGTCPKDKVGLKFFFKLCDRTPMLQTQGRGTRFASVSQTKAVFSCNMHV